MNGAVSIRISDDPAELDRERILRWITEESYWAAGRAAEKQDAAIAGSWNFGAYDEATGEQLGFAGSERFQVLRPQAELERG